MSIDSIAIIDPLSSSIRQGHHIDPTLSPPSCGQQPGYVFPSLVEYRSLFQYYTASINTAMLRNLECEHMLSRFTQKGGHVQCMGRVVNFAGQTPLRRSRVTAREDEARLVDKDGEGGLNIMAHSSI